MIMKLGGDKDGYQYNDLLASDVIIVQSEVMHHHFMLIFSMVKSHAKKLSCKYHVILCIC